MHLHTVVIDVALVFIVPLAAIALFILADQGLTRLARYLVTSPKSRKAENKMCTDLKVLPATKSCSRCATCKHADKPGGCAALIQAKRDAKAARSSSDTASSSEASNQDK